MEIILLVIFICLSAFFSASETAFFSIHASKVRLMVREKVTGAHLIQRLKSNPEKLLITILIGNTIANISIGAYSTAIAMSMFGSLGVGIFTGVSTVVLLICGEIVPKSFAYNNNIKVAQVTAYPLIVATFILSPLGMVLSYINNKLNKKKNRIHTHITEDEVLIMSRMSVEKGGIDYDEHALIERVFKWNDTKVGKIMTALPRIEFINGEVPIDQIAYHISQTEHSRYPVYLNSEDNIVGYIHINSVMKALNSKDRDMPVSQFASPILSIDENIEIDRAFKFMNKKHAHMCLVHKHGSTKTIVGLITLEDILEELVGEIEDETDFK
jgi:putative hemolysin